MNSTIKPTLANKAEIINKWLIDNGVKINNKLIKIVYLGKDNNFEQTENTTNTTTNERINDSIVSGLGVISLKELKVDDVIAKIPKSIILSIHTCSISNILEKYKIENNIGTSIALIHEATLGEQSKWYGYISSLPRKVDVPILWDSKSRKLLKGTSIEDVLNDDDILISQVYADVIVATLSKNHPEIFGDKELYSLENFKIANSIISSRAFCVDSYHGDSLVPLADIFNHRTARENVHIESNGDVCNKCGSIKTCKHRKVVTQHSHTVTKGKRAHKVVGIPSSKKHIHKGNCCGGSKETTSNKSNDDKDTIIEEDDEHLYIKVVKGVEINKEVYNTYGDHDNAILLSKYGFLEMDNPCDRLSIDKQLIDKELELVGGENQITRMDLFNRISFYAEMFDIDSRNNHAIENDGRLDDALVCSVGIALAPQSIFQGWKSMSEYKREKYFEQLEAEDIVKQSQLVRNTLLLVLNKLFSNYSDDKPTTIEQDQEKLLTLTDQREIIAQSLKICEKTLINKSINYYKNL
ncbi:hypothetical protein RB653_002477 [Dictyostelium firmibasis]|uniref:N-lysine methyltransferase n=1 Tax=Dictyostelium firmibasis TaxID=79012 RepID=A0AAN7YN21_9MYCE